MYNKNNKKTFQNKTQTFNITTKITWIEGQRISLGGANKEIKAILFEI